MDSKKSTNQMMGELMFKARTEWGLSERAICDVFDEVLHTKNSHGVLLKLREKK